MKVLVFLFGLVFGFCGNASISYADAEKYFSGEANTLKILATEYETFNKDLLHLMCQNSKGAMTEEEYEKYLKRVDEWVEPGVEAFGLDMPKDLAECTALALKKAGYMLTENLYQIPNTSTVFATFATMR